MRPEAEVTYSEVFLRRGAFFFSSARGARSQIGGFIQLTSGCVVHWCLTSCSRGAGGINVVSGGSSRSLNTKSRTDSHVSAISGAISGGDSGSGAGGGSSRPRAGTGDVEMAYFPVSYGSLVCCVEILRDLRSYLTASDDGARSS